MLYINYTSKKWSCYKHQKHQQRCYRIAPELKGEDCPLLSTCQSHEKKFK